MNAVKLICIMKTNQVMTRKMGQFDVLQRTSDGMFNATTLLSLWNNANPHQKRDLDNFWKSTNLTELMSEIAENELGFKSVDFTDLKSTLSCARRGKRSGGTWLNPILFVKFAMWLNPRFEYHVLKFVSDELIKYRNDAGDAYREMSAAVQRIVGKSEMMDKIQHVAKAINHIVFGARESEIRNKMAEEGSMRELFELERKVASLINEGFITDFKGLIDYLRRLWNAKYRPAILQSA
jgi:hypothetical protein